MSRKCLLSTIMVSLLIASFHLVSCGRGEGPPTLVSSGCTVCPDTIDFGPVPLRRQTNREFVIRNTGTEDLTLHVQESSNDFNLVFVDADPFILGPSDSQQVTVSFAPQHLGVSATTISLGDDVCSNVHVQGEGYPSDACIVTPTSLNFGHVRIGDTMELPVTIRNIGPHTLDGAIRLVGSEAYSAVGFPGPFSLAEAESLVVAIRFTPLQPLVREEASLHTDNATCGVVTCSGTGLYGRTWRVREDGQGDAPTIQAAIDSAAAGDTVLVGPGHYLTNLDFKGRSLVLRSEAGPEQTVLDGSSAIESVIWLRAGTLPTAVEGFTITGGSGHSRDGGSGPSRNGGGVFVDAFDAEIRNNIFKDNVVTPPFAAGGALYAFAFDDGHLLTIRDNLFENNHAEGNGGAMRTGGYTCIITNNQFRGNTCGYDGGALNNVGGRGASVWITENEFWENEAGDHGGAIEAAGGALTEEYVIESNLFVRNRAFGLDIPSSTFQVDGSGGAISLRSSPSGRVQFNTFIDNLASRPPSHADSLGVINIKGSEGALVTNNIFAGSEGYAIGCYRIQSRPMFLDNLFWHSEPDHFRQDICWTPHDQLLIADPLFCDPENDDYRLQIGSPALELMIGALRDAGCGTPIRRRPWGPLSTRY